MVTMQYAYNCFKSCCYSVRGQQRAVFALHQKKFSKNYIYFIKGVQIKTNHFQLSYIIVFLISQVTFHLQKSFCMQNKDTMTVLFILHTKHDQNHGLLSKKEKENNSQKLL